MQRLRVGVGDAGPRRPRLVVPDELSREILLLLPVKSLMRFKCVRKSWKLIISDPQFVKLHLRRSSDNITDFAHTQFVFQSNTLDGSLSLLQPSNISLCPFPLLFSSSQNQEGHLYPVDKGYQLIGVCNGLLCMIKWKFNSSEQNLRTCTCWVRLWNPATRLWSPLSPSLSSLQPPDATFGFGYDCLNDTYKVVVILDCLNSLQERVMKVYNIGGNCWRNIPIPTRAWLWPTPKRNGVYVSGTLNWLVTVNPDIFIIVSLELGREECSQLLLPHSCQHVEELGLPPVILEDMKDSLCILQNKGENGFVVWQMKEFGAHESWTKLFSFGFEEDFVLRIILFVPMQFILSKNNEVLLMSSDELVLYNPRDNTFKFSSRGAQDYFTYSFFETYSWVHTYFESLVSPY